MVLLKRHTCHSTCSSSVSNHGSITRVYQSSVLVNRKSIVDSKNRFLPTYDRGRLCVVCANLSAACVSMSDRLIGPKYFCISRKESLPPASPTVVNASGLLFMRAAIVND